MNNILYIVMVICAIWVIFDVWTRQKMSTGAKLVWTIFALLFSIITAIVYYFMKKKIASKAHIQMWASYSLSFYH